MQSPLADRLRPRTLAEVCGQQHLLGPGRVFRKAIESGRVPNMIFYGPSGVGKTTVARIIAENSGMRLHKLNGTSAGTGDIKAVMAEIGTFQSRNGLLLYLDEIQYLNKKQQQSLLECMEDGTVTLIASTTENPYFYIYNALLSRATVFEFKPLTPEDVRRGLENALHKLEELDGVAVAKDQLDINMVFLTLNGLAAPERFVDALKEQGILINGADHGVYRLVTHWGIETADLPRIAAAIDRCRKEL